MIILSSILFFITSACYADQITVNTSELVLGPHLEKAFTRVDANFTDLYTGPLTILDSDGNEIFTITGTGNLENINGLDTVTAEGGAGLWVMKYGDETPEHTNQTGWYDATGGTYEKIFTKVTGDAFTQADADNENFIVFQGAQHPKAAEIKIFISATQVVVRPMGWSADIATGAAPVSFYTYKHPEFFVGDGGDGEFFVGSEGKFEVESLAFTGGEVFEVEMFSAADGTKGQKIYTKANGYNQVVAFQVVHEIGAIVAGDVGAGLAVRLDESESASTDASAKLAAYSAETTAVGSETISAFKVFPGFTYALDVEGAEAEDPGFGWETTSGTAIDRVNSGGAGDDAFVVAGTDNELFTSDNDVVLIGSANTFELIEVILATDSNRNLYTDFYYSKAGGNWTALTIQTDGTRGMRDSGLIIFDAPGDWSKDNEDMSANAITDAYYIAIQRTRNATPPTLPVESFFKTYANQETGMKIDGNGFIIPRSAADADAPVSSIYYSTDQSKLVFKDSGGTVKDLY